MILSERFFSRPFSPYISIFMMPWVAQSLHRPSYVSAVIASVIFGWWGDSIGPKGGTRSRQTTLYPADTANETTHRRQQRFCSCTSHDSKMESIGSSSGRGPTPDGERPNDRPETAKRHLTSTRLFHGGRELKYPYLSR